MNIKRNKIWKRLIWVLVLLLLFSFVKPQTVKAGVIGTLLDVARGNIV